MPIHPKRTRSTIAAKASRRPLILLTNDDGFYSPGIRALAESLDDLGQVWIVAPDRERSGTSLSITLHHPLRVKKTGDRVYAVDGTPADCVYMAVQKILPRKPDILVSGINSGPNLGQQDISYSGTMAGALQGTFLRIPSLALSLMSGASGKFDYPFAARLARKFAARILESPPNEGVTLNVNIPPPPVKGIRLVSLGEKRYNPEIVIKTDPRGRTYYWIGTGNPRAVGGEGTDVRVIKKGYVTVTPVHRDLTAHQSLEDGRLKRTIEGIDDEMA